MGTYLSDIKSHQNNRRPAMRRRSLRVALYKPIFHPNWKLQRLVLASFVKAKYCFLNVFKHMLPLLKDPSIGIRSPLILL